VDLYHEAGRRAGHDKSKLKVGLHMFGYIADSTQQASDDFWPGYSTMFTQIGKERGWPPTSRQQFDNTRGPRGAYLIDEPNAVVDKVLHINEELGGIARLDFQMTTAMLPHAKMRHAIELLGTKVAPAVRKALRVHAGE
jgi:alkanesulfonate monooxygenase SsuD/methylene tetrahydromethanopterin reductase-like flavin-dependent oxidoreductase (luciferase family)